MKHRVLSPSSIARSPIAREAGISPTRISPNGRPRNDATRRQAILGPLGLLALVAAGAFGQRYWIASRAPQRSGRSVH